jgi:hypothetical protein
MGNPAENLCIGAFRKAADVPVETIRICFYPL